MGCSFTLIISQFYYYSKLMFTNLETSVHAFLNSNPALTFQFGDLNNGRISYFFSKRCVFFWNWNTHKENNNEI